jgi:purine nucleoside phosphorylase
MEDKLTKIKEAASYIAERLKCAPRAGLILGSGLGVLADEIEEGVRIPYEEVIVANHAGMRVLGISCITDMALGEELEPLTHEQVMEVANRTRPRFISLVKSIVTGV